MFAIAIAIAISVGGYAVCCLMPGNSFELGMSWLYEVPFWLRGIAVMSALALVAAVERVVVGARAQRWKEYGAWVVMGALGAGFGACNDLVTSRVSAHYFELGKGLSSVDPQQFVRDVADLGARAGFSAGLLLGGVLLLANTTRSSVPSLRVVKLLAHALVPIALAAALAPIVAFSTDWDIQGLGDELRPVLSESDVDAFLFVQRAHAVAYIGAALGTCIACLSVIRSRRSRDTSARTGESIKRQGLSQWRPQGVATDELVDRSTTQVR